MATLSSASAAMEMPNIFDNKGMMELQTRARRDPDGALEVVAKQFEAYFIGLMLKQARQSLMGSMLDSQQSMMFSGMYDQQLSLSLAQNGGIGFADMLVKQLQYQKGPKNRPTEDKNALAIGEEETGNRDDTAKLRGRTIRQNHTMPSSPLGLPSQNPPTAGTLNATAAEATSPFQSQRNLYGQPQRVPQPTEVNQRTLYQPTAFDRPETFIEQVRPHAEEAARLTGIPAKFLIAHAALETGWGKHQIQQANGQPSFNLFGIKAGKQWTGKVAHATTNEFIDGQMQRQVEPFRAYDSYKESFLDYANLLKSNPRYQKVLQQTTPAAFAQSLQDAGYATDPHYAKKLESVILAQKLNGIS